MWLRDSSIMWMRPLCAPLSHTGSSPRLPLVSCQGSELKCVCANQKDSIRVRTWRGASDTDRLICVQTRPTRRRHRHRRRRDTSRHRHILPRGTLLHCFRLSKLHRRTLHRHKRLTPEQHRDSERLSDPDTATDTDTDTEERHRPWESGHLAYTDTTVSITQPLTAVWWGGKMGGILRQGRCDKISGWWVS